MNKYKIDHGIIVAAGNAHHSQDKYNMAVIADWAAKRLITESLITEIKNLPFEYVLLYERNRTGRSASLMLNKKRCLAWFNQTVTGGITPRLLSDLPDNPTISMWNNQNVFDLVKHIVSLPMSDLVKECKQYNYKQLLSLRVAMKKLYLESEGLNLDALLASDKIKAVMNQPPRPLSAK